jgi:ABC-type polysaccharide/polyol phosphate transport system ATPase subunit
MSTSRSNNESHLAGGELLRIEDLDLVLKVPTFESNSIRDQAVQLLKNPFDHFRRQSNRFHVLKKINLTIKQGDRIALLGKNGVGKSSLCRCMAGYYRPTRGKIISPFEVRAYFDTQVGILGDLTGRENAYLLAAFMYPQLKARHNEIVEEAIDFSELKGFINAPFRTYSNGMAARLCLSLITAQPSEIFILDEVFEGADHFFKEKLRPRMMQAIGQSGAVVFVSHNEDQIRAVANRAVVIDQSQVVLDASVDEALGFYLRSGNSF